MCYSWVENSSYLRKMIVCVQPDPQQYSTDTEGRESIHMHLGIKECFGKKECQQYVVLFLVVLVGYYELWQIPPKNSISFSCLLSKLIWLH